LFSIIRNGRFPLPTLDVQFPSMNNIQFIQAKLTQAADSLGLGMYCRVQNVLAGAPFAENGGVSA
jgi:hypothetical protein